MNRKGIGIGSASLVLVFTVLCLVIFTIVSYTSAKNEMTLAQSEAELVIGYYEADALANQILAELLTMDIIPQTLRDVELHSHWNPSLEAYVVEFSCMIAPQKVLFVQVALYENDYEVLTWQLRNTQDWEPDTRIPLMF